MLTSSPPHCDALRPIYSPVPFIAAEAHPSYFAPGSPRPLYVSGMGGPPVMVMYTALSIPKDVVRGTNAWINVFQVGPRGRGRRLGRTELAGL